MGGTNWSDAAYSDRAAVRARTNTPTFAHSADIDAGRVAPAAHRNLDPKGVAFRESRDSDAHPTAVPIMVLFDVTGSMRRVPRTVQAKLPALMGLLIRKGFLEHPAICVGAIGDANSDRVPLQVGQFESGVEIENDLTSIYLEGNGGSQEHETYELALYFAWKHTVADHWEKRGEKGYIFVIGDEMPYDALKPEHVERILGESIEGPIPVEDIVAGLSERWEVFFVTPNLTSYYSREDIRDRWRDLLPERVLRLEDPDAVCELIAAQIGVCEGKTDPDRVVDDLVAAGTARATAAAAGRAIVPATSAPGAVQRVPSSGAASGLATL